ncbi:hypothetical protein BAUCODRAFT_69749 [Baudoinia panamericana UAMH 10762]|uniref:Histone deacetylase n=1 Tax=Baudoinia panamericana (strain UAMH 10762) TaxID=717646 RepID=M2MXG6_BAUPA|nr:uncharacterized protein BAUCODRAFT_69749 [Baudoinia panamericana UAMH 10762]EMC96258.1 hypothetical protein BAUCODRAFT_69749 [Baudoinia panamericana UAMH 10762]
MQDGDGDVLVSTERFTQFTDSVIKPENDDFVLSLPATLKGAGIIRAAEVFDKLDPKEDKPQQSKFKALPYATSQTGLVYDVRMRFHCEVNPAEDDVHPEDPRRIHAIFEAFVQAGLAWAKRFGTFSNFYMGRIDARLVTKEEVCLVHAERHWDWIQTLSTRSPEELEDLVQHPGQRQLDSIYISPNTPFCAALSAGGAIEACRAVMLSKVKNAFAVIRPPGHHAEREDVKGFCFYDNVSIATRVCQREFGERCRKVFILDWDVHHGNGIQQATYDDQNVLYISLHVHKSGNFYPERSYRDERGPYGDHLHCGGDTALGRNVNIPWRNYGMGDADYIYAFQQVVMPIATEFEPDLVIIAAGFDAAEGDMLGGCFVTPAGYAHMTHMLMSLAQGKVAVCLEGGYNLQSIARSACAVGRTLMGEPPDRLTNLNPTRSGVEDVKMVARQQSKFWSCLYPKDLSAQLAGPLHGERMHDLVRRTQAAELWEQHQMTPLFIHRDKLSKSFENQVLATPNYMEARPLFVILHEPPGIVPEPDPRTGKIELHNLWLTDIVKSYVDWAAKEDFAVIDVNLPRYVTDVSDAQDYQDSDKAEARTKEATEVLAYLWDNYIEPNEATHVILMGTNTGHGAIVNFIKANEERATERLTKAISLIEDVSLQSCKSPTNEDLPRWYYNVSMVFISYRHSFWEMEIARKPKRRFGRLFQSHNDTISDMLANHEDQITSELLSVTADWGSRRPVEVDEEMEDQALFQTPLGGTLPFSSPAKSLHTASSPRLPPVGNFAPGARQGTSPRKGSPTKSLVQPASHLTTPPRKGDAQGISR